ncbi:hypothetical protein [Ekhidna sp.]
MKEDYNKKAEARYHKNYFLGPSDLTRIQSYHIGFVKGYLDAIEQEGVEQLKKDIEIVKRAHSNLKKSHDKVVTEKDQLLKEMASKLQSSNSMLKRASAYISNARTIDQAVQENEQTLSKYKELVS